LGHKVSHPAVQELLSKCGGPTGLRRAGRRKLSALVASRAPRMGTRLVEAVLTALDEQTVTVPGTAAVETVLPRLADSLRQVLHQRDQVAAEVERILDARRRRQDRRPDPSRSRRRLRVRHRGSSRRLRRPRPDHPPFRQQHPPRAATNKLKRAFFLAAFASLSHPPSRVYYDRKRAEGKKHNAALICLARRRVDVL
jgi:hypothetical protein